MAARSSQDSPSWQQATQISRMGIGDQCAMTVGRYNIAPGRHPTGLRAQTKLSSRDFLPREFSGMQSDEVVHGERLLACEPE